MDVKTVPLVLLLRCRIAGRRVDGGFPTTPDQVDRNTAGDVIEELVLVGPEIRLNGLNKEGVSLRVRQADHRALVAPFVTARVATRIAALVTSRVTTQITATRISTQVSA